LSPQRGPNLPYKLVAGVTPVRKKWLVASAKMAGSTFAPEDPKLYDTFREVVDMRPPFSLIVVNAPIGYREDNSKGPRLCDLEARAMLDKRGRFLRKAPTRETLQRGYATPDDHLNAITLMLMPVFVEVFNEMSAYRQRTVYEGTPELSFFQLNGEQPLLYSKHTIEGREERWSLLTKRINGIERVLDAQIKGVSGEHLTDASMLLVTARRVLAHAAKRIPLHPEWDSEGLRMELVF
jgi:predicted RNase H-like nuclease